MIACTVIARNYLAYARVLARSFRAFNPDTSFVVLVLDDRDGVVSGGDDFEVLRPNGIGLDEREFHRMATMYSVLELATAVKPWLLRTLLDRGAQAVAYVDPDIQFFACIDDVFALAREHTIVLTPHATQPIPNDGLNISEQRLRLSGAYNLGFLAVSASAETFLGWWGERLARNCRHAVEEGEFVDQRYIDLVPSLFDHATLRDPTVNVAYWNTHYRNVQWTGSRYEVNGLPLRFYHFSGFDPTQPWLLSTFQPDPPRILLSEQPGLARLCSEYADALIQAGFFDCLNLPYAYEDLPEGLDVDSRMRRLYRDALLEAERNGGPEPPNPFSDSTASFATWLREPVTASGVSRYVKRIYDERADVRIAFPDLEDDGDSYLEWARTDGREAEQIPAELVPSFPRKSREASRLPPAVDGPGVNLVGYFNAELGVGEVARQLSVALSAAGLPFSTVAVHETVHREGHLFSDDGIQSARYGINLLCVNADVTPHLPRLLDAELLGTRYSIGFWWWEVSNFPQEMHRAFDFVDEIWVGSRFVQHALSPASTKEIVHVPIPLSFPEASDRTRSEVGLPEGFVFLFSFDFESVFERKNALGTIEAFQRAFPPGEGAKLVLKSINGHRWLSRLERLRAAVAGREDIVVIDGFVDPDEKNAMTALCDCYVSLHRSEGLGLTLAEAMWYARPVIATAYGGNTDFLTAENGFPVPYTLVPIGPGNHPYPENGEWAAPDLDAAARLMRQVYDNPEHAASIGEAGQRTIRVEHSPERAGAIIARRLDSIREQRSRLPVEREPADGSDPGTTGESGLARAQNWLGSGPVNAWDAPSRARGFGRLARSAVRRLLRPYETRQRELEQALVDTLVDMDGRLAELEAHAGVPAEALEHVRGLELEFARLDELVETQRRAAGELTESVFRSHERERASIEAIRASLAGSEREREEHVEAFTTRLASLREHLDTLDAALHAVPYVSDRSLVETENGDVAKIGFARGSHRGRKGTYVAFEDVFRGPESLIRERQGRYLDVLRGHEPVLDVGCGRGELLDLLAADGIEASGVDIDPAMVELCRAKGHRVELSDAVDQLERIGGGQLGAIFTAQVIEHLEFARLLALLEASRKCLVPGGPLILETVNPHAIHALKTFWVDPTHRGPIFPEVAVTLCRASDFDSAVVVYPNGSGDHERDRRSQGEYAVIAVKAGGEEAAVLAAKMTIAAAQ